MGLVSVWFVFFYYFGSVISLISFFHDSVFSVIFFLNLISFSIFFPLIVRITKKRHGKKKE